MNLIKGIPILIEAWKNIQNKIDIACELILAGIMDGDVTHLIKKEYKNINNIKFMGWVDNKEKLYKSSDIFICPSLSDAGPTTVYEALSNNLPVIISKNCGFANIILENGLGFVYNPLEVSELEKILIEIMKNKSILSEIIRNIQVYKKSIENDKSYINGLLQELLV